MNLYINYGCQVINYGARMRTWARAHTPANQRTITLRERERERLREKTRLRERERETKHADWFVITDLEKQENSIQKRLERINYGICIIIMIHVHCVSSTMLNVAFSSYASKMCGCHVAGSVRFSIIVTIVVAVALLMLLLLLLLLLLLFQWNAKYAPMIENNRATCKNITCHVQWNTTWARRYYSHSATT